MPKPKPAPKGAPPHDYYGKKRADAVGSSRMGELRYEDEAPKMGMGDARLIEHKARVAADYARRGARYRLRHARRQGQGKQA